MKIALIGAPSSGKTELAQQLATELPDCQVVDNYVKTVEDRSNIVLGQWGTYVGNMQVALARWEAERMATKQSAPNVVVCGSIIETGVYEAIEAYSLAEVSNASERLQLDARAGCTMTWFGIFKNDTYDCDHAFYLPLPEDHQDKFEALVDNQIAEAADAFEIEYITLSADRNARLQEVLGVVRENDGATSPADGQSVGDSREEAVEDQRID